MITEASVLGVYRDSLHRFSKQDTHEIELLEGLGVDGDAHLGETVQHRSRVRADPTAPNLRQVHLMHSELFAWLGARGFDVQGGQLGENVTTVGVDLLDLPVGSRLHLGSSAVVELTGLRNPCMQINDFMPGLLRELVGTTDDGAVVRRAGVMGVVLASGIVRPGDQIVVSLPAEPHRKLERV